MKRNKGLGRGLDALLGGDLSVRAPAASSTLPLTRLRPGRYQPRTKMNTDSLRELAESIKTQGVIQPVLVRAIDGNGSEYEIIAGERRVRAAAMAGLAEVPVIIKQVPDEAALAMALIENIQREDLNPLEEAHGVARLIREFGFTHDQAAQAIGRSRSATSNLLRLVNLADPVQHLVMEGRLDMGHARALLSMSAANQIQLASRIAAEQLSVRAVEALVARGGVAKTRKSKKTTGRSRDIVQLEDELSDSLGATVKVLANARGKGAVTIQFSTLDQLEGIVTRLRG